MAAWSPDQPVIEVDDLRRSFRLGQTSFDAVAGVSFTVARGETLGLVGESGCGKSTTGRAILRLPPPTSGTVKLEGVDMATFSKSEMSEARRRLQVIFQDPISALNPRRRARDIVAEGLVIRGGERGRIGERVDAILQQVGFNPDIVGNRRPHQLSGGQCQRLAIARALVVDPEVLICDEPVASLDVSIQGQVLNLLEDMRERLGLAMLFISHDLSVVHKISDRIAVMYLGKLVEIGTSNEICRTPAHPYTRALLDAVPQAEAGGTVPAPTVGGEVPSPARPPSGCRFRTRCPRATERCAAEEPVLRQVTDTQQVACHFPLIPTESDSAPSPSERMTTHVPAT